MLIDMEKTGELYERLYARAVRYFDWRWGRGFRFPMSNRFREVLASAVERVAGRLMARHPERFAVPATARDGPAHWRLRTRVEAD